MKNKTTHISIVTIVILLASASSFAYKEKTTHPDLSKAAYGQSILANASTLKDMGIEDATFNNPSATPQKIEDLLAYGAEHEDDGVRPGNHFYDPKSDTPLWLCSLVCNTSPSWALEDKGNISSQEFSFKDARKYLYEGLTKPDKTARNALLGKTFATLGNVVHHIQDMAQPQHVRNDQHLTGVNTSLYERYTAQNQAQVRLIAGEGQNAAVFTQETPNGFAAPRDFWINARGNGIAQFTNENFVSAGTNFDIYRSQPVPNSRYSAPVPTGQQDIALVDLLAEKGESLPPALALDCASPTKCKVAMIASVVTDKLTNLSQTNDRASTLSLFDAALRKYAKEENNADRYTLQTYKTDRAFTLNRFNFDAAHAFLLPRAVGYSAGLINYFFRGNIDLVEDDNDPTLWVIENAGTEDMQGTFELYCEATDGSRKLAPNAQWNKTVLKGAKSDAVSFSPPSDAAKSGEYLLVFHGTMGQEPQADGTGAVVAKKVTPQVAAIFRTDSFISRADGYGGAEFHVEWPAKMLRRLSADPRSISVVTSEGASASGGVYAQSSGWVPETLIWGEGANEFYWEVTLVENNAIEYYLYPWVHFVANSDSADYPDNSNYNILRSNGIAIQGYGFADLGKFHTLELRFKGKRLFSFAYQLRPRADFAYDAVISNPVNIKVKDKDNFQAVRTVAAAT